MDKYRSKIVEEPALAYDMVPSRYHQISDIIGDIGTSVHNEQDIIARTRVGLRRQSLDAIATGLGISLESLSKLLHISYRTLLRKKKDDLLSVHVSEQVFMIAEVIRRGLEVLGSPEAFTSWLKTNLSSLDNHTPLSYLDTSFGVNIVLRILGRIEHGVF